MPLETLHTWAEVCGHIGVLEADRETAAASTNASIETGDSTALAVVFSLGNASVHPGLDYALDVRRCKRIFVAA